MSDSTEAGSRVFVGSKRRSIPADLVFRLLKEKPLGLAGAIITLVFIITGVFANFLAPYGYDEIIKGAFREAPSAQFWLGTDNLGRDMLSRVIYGARISMIVGLAGTSISVVVAMSIGLVTGFFGGRLDIVVQRLVDAVMCFPWLVFVLGIMAAIGGGMTQVIIVLGLINGTRNSRIIRSAVISIKENVYVNAARAIGCTGPRLLARHILPNVLAPAIIIFNISVGYMIIAEATLSFLGYGIPPPTPSWGGMLTIGGRRYMLLAPWIAVGPGVALSLVVFGVNVLGDAVRDLLDPRLRGGLGSYTRKGKK